MASAQVMPNSAASSRKQGHLEAGKRRLEEFRKKKAQERSKKAASTGHSADVSQYEKQPQEREHMRLTDSDGAVTSERDGVASIEPSGLVMAGDSEAIDFLQSSTTGSSNGTHTSSPVSTNNNNAFFADPVQKPVKDHSSKWYDGSGFPGPVYSNYDRLKEENYGLATYTGSERGPAYGDLSGALHPPRGFRDVDSSANQSSSYSIGEAQKKENESSLHEYTVKYPVTSHVFVASIPPEKSANVLLQSEVGYASKLASGNTSNLYEVDSIHQTNLTASTSEDQNYNHANMEFNGRMTYNMGGRKLSSSIDHCLSADSAPLQTSGSLSSGFNFDSKSSSDHVPIYSSISETGTRRSRPSFLDSLNVPRISSVPLLPLTEAEKAASFMSKSSEIHSVDILASTASQKPFMETETMGPLAEFRTPNLLSAPEPPTNSSFSASNEGELVRQSMKGYNTERMHDFRSPKQDEDFAALEQHIEDLTQEKFSLQRAFEASRALAESLAVENSSLTDSYNQQGTAVNQLKSDIERLQEEIKAQLVELESVKIEYMNAQLECNAADERAKLLASEVIGLEEKALRLRSSELKLERQLENSNAEISSYKKKMASLEKEHQDLQSTIDALREEKKLLQSKLRKASATGKFIDSKTSPIIKNVSTSTEDLGVEIFSSVHGENSGAESADTMANTFNSEMQHTASFPSSSNNFSFPLLPENRQFKLEVSSATIPPDQLRMIGNINTLISELAVEKEELMRALAAESSQSSELKDMNKELSRKLEAQTQRLELLTTQSMVNENIPARQTDSRTMHDSTVYTDEGDEVVERVLGWIMKLFPGGPSKRRTSKLL